MCDETSQRKTRFYATSHAVPFYAMSCAVWFYAASCAEGEFDLMRRWVTSVKGDESTRELKIQKVKSAKCWALWRPYMIGRNVVGHVWRDQHMAGLTLMMGKLVKTNDRLRGGPTPLHLGAMYIWMGKLVEG